MYSDITPGIDGIKLLFITIPDQKWRVRDGVVDSPSLKRKKFADPDHLRIKSISYPGSYNRCTLVWMFR
jgi:hypothetical protein